MTDEVDGLIKYFIYFYFAFLIYTKYIQYKKNTKSKAICVETKTNASYLQLLH